MELAAHSTRGRPQHVESGGGHIVTGVGHRTQHKDKRSTCKSGSHRQATGNTPGAPRDPRSASVDCSGWLKMHSTPQQLKN